MLVRAGRGGSRLPQPARTGDRPGDRRRSQRQYHARPVYQFLQMGDVGQQRALQDLRQFGGRVRARGRLRDCGIEAPVRCAGCRGSHPCRDSRHGGEPGWPEQRVLGTQWIGAGVGNSRGPGECRGGAGGSELRGDARDGNLAGRSHRSGGAGPGVGGEGAAQRAAGDRVGQDQRGAPGGGGRGGGADQGGAGAAAPADSGAFAPAAAQRAHRLGAVRHRDPDGIAGVGRSGREADRGGELVRFQRHQCARGGGTGARAGGSGQPGRAAVACADGIGEERGGAGGDGGRLCRAAAGRGRGPAGGPVLHGQRGAGALRAAAERGGGHAGRDGAEAGRRGGSRPRGSRGADEAAGGVSVHRARVAVRGDGAAVVRGFAAVPGDAAALRDAAAREAGAGIAGSDVRGQRGGTGADGEHAAGAVCAGVRAGGAVAELGGGASGGAGAQRGGVRGGVRGGGLQPGRRAGTDRRARAADAGGAGGRGDGGGDGAGGAGARGGGGVCGDLDCGGEWAGERGGIGGSGGSGVAVREAAGVGGAEPAITGFARVPLTADGWGDRASWRRRRGGCGCRSRGCGWCRT